MDMRVEKYRNVFTNLCKYGKIYLSKFKGGIKMVGKTFSIKKLLALVVVFAVFISTAKIVTADSYAEVAAKIGLNLRSEPVNGRVITVMPKGAQVKILSDGSWAKVEYNGIQGYCSKQYLSNVTSKSSGDGFYQTKLYGDDGRITNIKLATASINGKTIKAGEEFSFSAAIGGRTSTARGYKPATVITGNGYSTAVGGGICQVSSTLYAAVKQLPSGVVNITERWPHSLPVSYISREYEATIWAGQKDLKFIPNKDVTISAIIENGYLKIQIIV